MAAAILLAAPFICRAQDAASSTLPKPEAETEEIVVSATRLPIPEDESPASVTVITAQEMENKQIHRVADALREKLERERRKGLADRLVAIGRDCAAHLSEDAKRLNIDELLYDEKGLPK